MVTLTPTNRFLAAFHWHPASGSALHPEPLTPSSKLPVTHRLSIWNWIVNQVASSNEPRVWHRRDRRGETVWYVYDPMTHRSFSSTEEAAMRRWLEERYYWRNE